MHFHYSTKEEYDIKTLQLEARLINARIIPGTLRLHTFMPKGRGQLEVTAYSNSSEGSDVSMQPDVEEDVAFDDIKGFVTVMYDSTVGGIRHVYCKTAAWTCWSITIICLSTSTDILTTLATNI